jgi:hypothetical protein
MISPINIPLLDFFFVGAFCNSKITSVVLQFWRRTAFDLRRSEARVRRFESVVLDKEEATHAKPCDRGKNHAIGLERRDPTRVVIHLNQSQFNDPRLDASERVSSLASHD